MDIRRLKRIGGLAQPHPSPLPPREMRLAPIMVFALLLAPCVMLAATSSSPLDLSEDAVRTKETGIGSLVADAVRASASADAALIPAAAFKKASIAAGEISGKAICSALVFPDDTVIVLSLQGSQLRGALEKSVSIYPQKSLGFLQVSGVELVFDPRQRNARLVSVKVAGKPLKDDATYRIATTNSLASGALGYWRIWTKEQIVQKSNATLAKAVESYLAASKELDYRKAVRISVRG